MKKSVHKNEEMFQRVYDQYADDIYRLCYSYMKNKMDAEDVLQETFLKYFRSRKMWESMEHSKAWLIVTASNQCKNMLKHWSRKNRDLDSCPEIAGEEKSEVDETWELVMGLPEKYKTIVYLYYYEGYDSREIGKIIHKPDSTVRTWLQQARKLLKREWEK